MQPISPPPGRRPVDRERWLSPGSLGGLVCAGLAVICLFAVFDDRNATGLKVVAVVIAVVLGGLALTLLYGLLLNGNRTPRWTVDDEGIALWTVKGHAEVPWSSVAGVGIGFQVSPAGRRAIQRRQDAAIEVFVTDDFPSQVYPAAQAFVVSEQPPRADLPFLRLRIVPGIPVEARLRAQVEQFAPGRWVGSYQRAWERMPGR